MPANGLPLLLSLFDAAVAAAPSIAQALEAGWPGELSVMVDTRYGHRAPTARIEIVDAAQPVPGADGRAAVERLLNLVQGRSADDPWICLISGGASSVTASGPTVADASSCADALAILAEYAIREPKAAVDYIRRGHDEFPQPGDPRLVRACQVTIATPQMSLEAAAEVARTAGVIPLILGNALEGEAREMALVHAGIARQVLRPHQPTEQPTARPCLLLSGGEGTATVRGSSCGGRNVEFLLGLAVALDGEPGIAAIACNTDGTVENAGASLSPVTLARAHSNSLLAPACLANNDGYSFFAALDDLVVTGPTMTHGNDFRALLIR